MKSLIRIGLALLFVAQLSSIGLAQSGIITTYAGPALPVNGSLATSQAVDRPKAVASDGAGGFYVSTQNQHRVYRVTADGRINLVAGVGTIGYSGDGGPATSAQLNSPFSLALDMAGNLFILDYGSQCVRKVTPGGVISTVAGNGTPGFSGDGGPATSAQLNYPFGVAADTVGNLFIVDSGNQRVRKVTPDGVISTVAGNGTPGFSGDGGPATAAQLASPNQAAVDAAGNLFISDWAFRRIRKVTTDGVISTVAGNGYDGYGGDGGPATSAPLDWPTGVAVDTAGNLFIADTMINRIRKVTPGGVISTVAGDGTQGFGGDGGPATSAQLYSPNGVAVDTAGNLFIADEYNDRVRKVTSDGVISTVLGMETIGFSGDGGPATSAQLNQPSGVAMDTAGNLFIADAVNNRIRKVSPNGVISTVAGNGTRGFSGDGGPAILAQLGLGTGVAVDTAGNLFIADNDNYTFRVRKVSPGGVISTVAGGGTLDLIDGALATSGQLLGAQGVAVDMAGNLYIAEALKRRVRMVTPGGVISTVAGNGHDGSGGDGGPATAAQLKYPVAVAVDSAGNLFIADPLTDSVREVTPDGVINTVAGTGTPGFSGDGGPAIAAQINYPYGVAVDAAGNLFIADEFNNRVRKVAWPYVFMSLGSSVGGSAAFSTAGMNGTAQTGYATIAINSGAAPYGTAVFSFKQNGVTVSEAGVPASPPTTAARIFIDYRSAVAAIPGRISAGTVNIDTGIAAVNSGPASANVTYTLRNTAGAALAVGHGTFAAGGHFAKFIDQLSDVAPDFVLPVNFQADIQFASLEISSDQPLSILALRMTTNQRNEALFTTTPTADLTRSLIYAPVYFPQFADGGGYTTSLVLLNTSNGVETGTLQLMDDNGNPFVVNQVGGTAGSTFGYAIPSGGAFRFQTDGFPANTVAGWAQLTPDAGTSTPISAGVFGYNPGSFLVTESGIPATVSTTHVRVYVDLSGGHDTGLAIANPTNANASITITAFQSDGVTGIGTSQGPLPLPANGYSAGFADQFIAGLPAGFTGVLDIVSSTPFAALTVRSLTNERGDFLLATFPTADMTLDAPSPIVFPQIADGGGYVTQFILIGTGGASSVTLNFYGEDGKPLAVGK